MRADRKRRFVAGLLAVCLAVSQGMLPLPAYAGGTAAHAQHGAAAEADSTPNLPPPNRFWKIRLRMRRRRMA